MAKSEDEVRDEWDELVNMSASELEDWLKTDESRSVGQDDGDGEATGHKSGGRIVQILRKKKSDLDEDDRGHMAKVVGYIKRHAAQGGPDDDVEHSDWRYSLKNWGHDPMK